VSIPDTSSEGSISCTIVTSGRSSSESNEDQECLHLGGVLLEEDRRGDLLRGDLRVCDGDLTLAKCMGDRDLDGRIVPPLLLLGGKGSRI